MTADSMQQPLQNKPYANESRDLLVQYAEDRLAALWRRIVIYSVGWLLIMGQTSWQFGTFATAILLVGEAIDCFVLRKVKPRLEQGEDLQKVRRMTNAAGVVQGLSMSGATAMYVVTFGENSSILGVAAVLGMGVVNAALIIPTNPVVAIYKMVLFVGTPIALMGYKLIRFTEPGVPMEIEYPVLMVILSMAFMAYSFARAALDSFQRNEALKHSQRNLSNANETLEHQQIELQKLSMVARKTNDAVILMDADQKVEWVNEAFTNLSGIPEQWALGRSFKELFALANGQMDVQAFINESLASGEAHRTELRDEAADGTVRWAEIHLLPVSGEDGQVDFFVTIAREISAIKQHSETLKAARMAAEDAAKTKSDFLANMSHEIRTPLTGIIGMADLLSETEQTPDQADYTQTIIGSSRSLLTILNDILDLSKMEAGKLEINESRFDLRDCFDETMDLLRPAIVDKGLALNITFDPKLPETLVADDVRIRQILTNIISNATKFTEHGEINVNVWCSHTEQRANTRQTLLHFSIADTGIGIPKDKLATIFDEFTQAETSTTRRFGGTGLGLTICQVLVKMMGGKINVSSTFGEGSRFNVCLPVSIAPAATNSNDATQDSLEHIGDAIDLIGLDVLIAEDNKTNRLLIQKYLESLPINLRFANDGYEAVEATLESPPDLIFMDMSMPNMSGIEATEAIRASEADQPVIVALTANAFDSERRACIAAGMDDFLTKPIRRKELVSCLQKQAAARKMQTSAIKSAMEA